VVIFSVSERDIHVKLCDFGFARPESLVSGSLVGSPGYTAPVSLFFDTEHSIFATDTIISLRTGNNRKLQNLDPCDRHILSRKLVVL
jgi:serine/threonine protein kinase